MFENVRRWGEVVAEERSEPERKKKKKTILIKRFVFLIKT